MKRIANDRHAMLKRVLPILIKIAKPKNVAEAFSCFLMRFCGENAPKNEQAKNSFFACSYLIDYPIVTKRGGEKLFGEKFGGQSIIP